VDKKRQALSINGVKFFQDALDKIKVLHELSPLSSAAIGVYILYHFRCNDFGRVNAKELSLSDWAETTGIPYSTLHSGRQVLFERGLIEEMIIGKESFYQIVGYDQWNSPEIKNQGAYYNLSYFRISYKLLSSSLLKNLISTRNASGIILVLDLFNRITRTIGQMKQSRGQLVLSDIKNITVEYTMNTLKSKTKKTALKVRQLIEMLQDFFVFEAEDTRERKPKRDRVAAPRKKNVVQVVIEKYVVKVNPEILKYEEDELVTQTLQASLRKETVSKLDLLGITHRYHDIKDIMNAFKHEVIKVIQFSNQPVKDRNRFIANIFNEALTDFVEYYSENIKSNTNFKIGKLGALLRKLFRNTCKAYIERELDIGERIDIKTRFAKKYGKYPLIMVQN
jgi:hypothetical protein